MINVDKRFILFIKFNLIIYIFKFIGFFGRAGSSSLWVGFLLLGQAGSALQLQFMGLPLQWLLLWSWL